jgi:Bacteriophage head to tail connecting protein.
MSKELADTLRACYRDMADERELHGFSKKLEACAYMKHRQDSATGLVKNVVLHDSYAIGQVNTVVNGLESAVMPQNDYWFKFTVWGSDETKRRREKKADLGGASAKRELGKAGKEETFKGRYLTMDDVDGAMDYFESASQEILSELALSGYYIEKMKQIRDGIVLGYGIATTEDDVANDSMKFKCLDPLECCVEMDESRRLVRFARVFTLTRSELVNMYGMEGLPEKTRQSVLDTNVRGYRLLEYIGLDGRLYDGKGNAVHGDGKKFMHFLMMYDGMGEGEFFDVRGFDSMPVSVWNYMVSSSGAYGQGLVEFYLEDVKKLDDYERQRHSCIQYANNPAWGVPMSLQGRFSVAQGATNVIPDANSLPVPIQKTNQYAYQFISNAIADQQQKVMLLFGVDLFRTLMPSLGDSRKTATEVSVRKTEASQQLTNTLGNMQNVVSEELLRTFEIMRKAGRIGRGNEGVEALVRSGKLRVELDSIFIQRMRSFYMVDGNTAILNMVQVLAAVYPDLPLTIDFDRLTRMLATGLGTSQFAIYEKSETEKMRQARAQQQQAQMQQQAQLEQSQMNMNNARAQQAQMQGGMM